MRIYTAWRDWELTCTLALQELSLVWVCLRAPKESTGSSSAANLSPGCARWQSLASSQLLSSHRSGSLPYHNLVNKRFWWLARQERGEIEWLNCQPHLKVWQVISSDESEQTFSSRIVISGIPKQDSIINQSWEQDNLRPTTDQICRADMKLLLLAGRICSIRDRWPAGCHLRESHLQHHSDYLQRHEHNSVRLQGSCQWQLVAQAIGQRLVCSQ